MKTRSYGTIRMSVDQKGEDILRLPEALVRDLHLEAGDYVSLRDQKGPALHLRFFRKVKDRWLQLLPAPQTALKQVARFFGISKTKPLGILIARA